MDQTFTPGTPRSTESVVGRLLERIGFDTVYVATGFVLGLIGFSVVVTGLSAGLGLVVVWVGLAVLSATLMISRGLAQLERHRLVVLQGRHVPRPSYVVAPAGSGPVRRVLTPLRDPQSWLDALWALVSFVTGTIAFSVVAAWFTAVGAGLTYWFWQQWLPDQDETLVEILGLGEGRTAESLLQLGIAGVALLTLPVVVRGCAAMHAGTADALLNLRGR